METHPYLTISKILYIPSAIALLLYPLFSAYGFFVRIILLPGFALLFIPPGLCSSMHMHETSEFPLFLALTTLFSALFYALDLISVSDRGARKFIASILSITAFALFLLSIFLGPCLLLVLTTLFSALFYALDMISISDVKKRKRIVSILSIAILIPPALSSALSMLLRHFPPLSPEEKWICSVFLPSFLPLLQFAESKLSLFYIVVFFFALYMSFSFLMLRFSDVFDKEIGPVQAAEAALVPLVVWFLLFPAPILFLIGIIPCSAVIYAPLCKMREPMSTIKRTLICCQLLSFVFVFFVLPRLR